MLLDVKNLHVSFGGVKALNLSNFNVEQNELRVIIGPNGAGKSTFMDILCVRQDQTEVMSNLMDMKF